MVEKIEIKIPIVKSKDSDQKEKLINFKPIVVKNKDERIEIKPIDLKPVTYTANSIATTLYLTVAAVFVRYFIVVDIMINFFAKINVELGPRIGKLVDILKKAEVPNIGFTVMTSPINDGGDEAVENHENFLK